jgi:hypothetical protein
MNNRITLHGYTVALAEPWTPPTKHFAGRAAELRQCQAAWRIAPDGQSFLPGPTPPLNFRLEGPPGVGKNEIVYQIARRLKKPLYIIQGHEELTPEDLALLLVPDSAPSATGRGTSLILQASPLATAILVGGLFFFDEINRVPERALSPLASVLDERRSIYSALTGLTVGPLPGNEGQFRFCCALNPILSEAGRGVLPDYIEERTLPAIAVGYLKFAEILEIVRQNLWPDPSFLAAFQAWHEQNAARDVSVRQMIALVNYAMSLAGHGPLEPVDALREAGKGVVRTPEILAAPTGQRSQEELPPLVEAPEVNTYRIALKFYPNSIIGKTYLFEVQGVREGDLWGSGPYTDDSHLGKAAVHAGALGVGEWGVVQVTVSDTSGQSSFQSSERNSVMSANWGAYPRGLTIARLPGLAAPPAVNADPITLKRVSKIDAGRAYLFETAGKDQGPLYGSDVYTHDSNLGTAAVHAGALGLGERGVVRVTVVDTSDGRTAFPGTEKNGVRSSSWDQPWPTGFRIVRETGAAGT